MEPTNYPGIINNVLGPVTLGPSSSHLAGPLRLGRLTRNIVGEEMRSIKIVFQEGGSFAATYTQHKTDCALIAGLLGWDTDNPAIKEALKEAQQRKIKVKIEKAVLGVEHPNVVMLQIETVSGKEVNVTGISTGGGGVKVIRIDGSETDIEGQLPVLLVNLQFESDAPQVIPAIMNQIKGARLIKHDKYLVTIALQSHHGKLPALDSKKGISDMKVVEAVFPLNGGEGKGAPLFTSAEEILKMAEGEDRLSNIALAYEMKCMGWTRTQIYSHLDRMGAVMKNAVKKGLSEDLTFIGGITKQGSRSFYQKMLLGGTISGGTLARAAVYAMAVNEVSASMGLIVAAPTAGGCGVIPGVVLAVLEHLQPEDEQGTLRNALLCAGAVGVVFMQRATFLGEVCGCQAETGAAAAMAAAALVEIKGGSVCQSLDAAAITLQNILGLECDPVAGMMEVPCITRNALAALNAIISADIVMAGTESAIPLDEVIDAVYQTGRIRPAQCNGTSGLAITPTALSLKRGHP